MIPENKQEKWCRQFARLYATRRKCDAEAAAEVAKVVYPVLGLMRPAEAFEVLMSDESLSAAFSKKFPSSRT